MPPSHTQYPDMLEKETFQLTRQSSYRPIYKESELNTLKET